MAGGGAGARRQGRCFVIMVRSPAHVRTALATLHKTSGCGGSTHLARRLSGPPFERMRECTHLVKAEQPRNLGYMQLGVIKVSIRQIVPVVEVLQ